MARRRSAERARDASSLLVAAVLAVVVLAGCSQFGTQGIRLRTDDSITIQTPEDRSTVTAPLEVAWTDDEPRPGGSYAVLIDTAPMPPGEPVEWFARDDEDCAVSAGCPDEMWLARHGITVTSATSATIAVIPPRDESLEGGYYDLTIVRLDAEGRRDGEDAYVAQFRLERS